LRRHAPGATVGFILMAAIVLNSGSTAESEAVESATTSPMTRTSCVVDDGEWSWSSKSLDIAVGVDFGDVSYLKVDLHQASVCAGLGPVSTRFSIPWPHGWTGADCAWTGQLCESDSLGISVFILFGLPEENQAMCGFTLQQTQPTCGECAALQNITLTRQPPTTIGSQPWGRVKDVYREGR
jgi:hypothetical protein